MTADRLPGSDLSNNLRQLAGVVCSERSGCRARFTPSENRHRVRQAVFGTRRLARSGPAVTSKE